MTSIPSGLLATPTMLAHQGGWDEILLVAGPIVVIIVVLAIAKRRVDSIDRDRDEHPAPGSS